MPTKLSRERVIAAEVLREVGAARITDAEALFKSGRYAAAVYLAGYAVECHLKTAICHTLHWPELLGMFKVHDLDGLMTYSGFDDQLRTEPAIKASFGKILAIWEVEGNNSLRYRKQETVDEATARLFLKCVCDEETGVVPWLRRSIA